MVVLLPLAQDEVFPVQEVGDGDLALQVGHADVVQIRGAALDSESGPLMLGIMTAQNQLTGGDNWVKELCNIQVVPAQ